MGVLAKHFPSLRMKKNVLCASDAGDSWPNIRLAARLVRSKANLTYRFQVEPISTSAIAIAEAVRSIFQ